MKPALIALLTLCLCLPVLAQEKDKPLPKDIPSLKALAEKGDGRAQGQLAVNYTYGKGVEKDYAKALAWAKKSAEQEIPSGMFILGRSYQWGNGVKVNFVESVKWYRKAAEQGYASAQYNVAVMYRIGEGVLKDDKEAVKW